MIRRIKQLLVNHKIIIQNFSYLSALQVFNMLIPLITYPYLIRVLGKENYGFIVLAQTYISYLVVIVNFGFNISATKDISMHRYDKEKMNEIVSSVLIIKGILFIFSLILLIIGVYAIPQTREPRIIYFLFMWMCLYEFIFPVWYFQGIEKMKYITFISLASRIIFLFLIFFLIKREEHYLRVPVINGLGAIIAGIISLYIIFIKHKLKFIIIPITKLREYYRESFFLFLTNAIMTLKDKTNILLIGSFMGTGTVAEFDLAIKMKDLMFIPINLINQALYPKISKERDMRFMLRALKLLFFGITALTIILFPFVDNIVLFLGGKEMIESTKLTRIVLLSVPVVAISFTISTNCINALGYYKLRFKSMLLTTSFYILLVFLGVLLGWKEEITFYAYIIVIGYVVEFFYRLYLVNKYQMLK